MEVGRDRAALQPALRAGFRPAIRPRARIRRRQARADLPHLESLLLLLGCVGLAKDVGYLVFVWKRKAPIRFGRLVGQPAATQAHRPAVRGRIIDVVLVSSVL